MSSDFKEGWHYLVPRGHSLAVLTPGVPGSMIIPTSDIVDPEADMSPQGWPKDVPAKPSELGEVPTRELLEELRLRGDLAMTVLPTTERGQDGSFLSACAGLQLKALSRATLEAVRGS